MTVRHSFTMDDESTEDDASSSTHLEMNFYADQLDDLVDEFLNYLWHCGYTYVEKVEVHKTAEK